MQHFLNHLIILFEDKQKGKLSKFDKCQIHVKYIDNYLLISQVIVTKTPDLSMKSKKTHF